MGARLPDPIRELASCKEITFIRARGLKESEELARRIRELIEIARKVYGVKEEHWKRGCVLVGVRPTELPDEKMVALRDYNVIVLVLPFVRVEDFQRLGDYGVVPRVRWVRPELLK